MTTVNGSKDKVSAMNGTTVHLDALIVGGGFGGCYFLHLLRTRGFKVKLVEAQDAFGGVWNSNWYPGARVDCEMPYYLLSAPELMKDWIWTEKFPGAGELRSYFRHVDQVWELSKDAYFNSVVTEARFDEHEQLWHVQTANGLHFTCRWFLPATGTSHKQHIPDIPGMSKFRGAIHHPAAWPRENPLGVLKGKRIAVIGAGASGLQIVQEAVKVGVQVTQFIRTPNLAVPMRQRSISREEVGTTKPETSRLHDNVRKTPGGLPMQRSNLKTVEATPEEREKVWSANWEKGGFHFSGGSFGDVVTDKQANRLAYEFWAREQGARIPDPAKREVLVPKKQPYWLATKRPSMEQDYYEMISQPHADVTHSPVTAFDETGILTEDGKHREFDVVAISTGYDAVTGTLTGMNIRGRSGESLAQKWKDGVRTQLGMTAHGFPNMFFVYGPQAPTSLTSGPPFIEQQVEWVCNVIERARTEGWSSVEATARAEKEWTEFVHLLSTKTLLIETDSWYTGANIPGKKREVLLFLGGMPMYFEKCNAALEGMKGFTLRSTHSKFSGQRGKL